MRIILLASLSFALGAGCGSNRRGPDLAELALTSLSFADGEGIPDRHTCDGQDVSPELAWSDVPDSALSLVLIMDDPDSAEGVFTHWAVYDLPPGAGGLDEDADPLDLGARMGLSDFSQTAYRGPCPPSGEHRYFFKLFALDTEMGDLGEPSANDLLAAVEGHLVGTGGLMGIYQLKP